MSPATHGTPRGYGAEAAHDAVDGAPLVWTVVPSPVGPLTLVASAAGLRRVWFDDERVLAPTDAQRETAAGHAIRDDLAFVPVVDQLARYFDGDRAPLDLPLDLQGTPFQCEVWAVLQAIPLGATRTYGSVAAEISERRGKETSARAVAAAVGRTPAPIIVPCHRVIGGDGSLTGYAGGLHRKRALLELEGAAITSAGPGAATARATVSAGQLPLL